MKKENDLIFTGCSGRNTLNTMRNLLIIILCLCALSAGLTGCAKVNVTEEKDYTETENDDSQTLSENINEDDYTQEEIDERKYKDTYIQVEEPTGAASKGKPVLAPSMVWGEEDAKLWKKVVEGIHIERITDDKAFYVSDITSAGGVVVFSLLPTFVNQSTYPYTISKDYLYQLTEDCFGAEIAAMLPDLYERQADRESSYYSYYGGDWGEYFPTDQSIDDVEFNGKEVTLKGKSYFSGWDHTIQSNVNDTYGYVMKLEYNPSGVYSKFRFVSYQESFEEQVKNNT
ncbi:hypothetical protein [Oribacterium sp. FC2011]|uniref:hypothetical protein n=1 Tax=Oribacterium sp. FC2011 TaxID=1408311 RepID=UPI0004E10998|nr:hypothetical protein [Oribacterium sp. FC2011]